MGDPCQLPSNSKIEPLRAQTPRRTSERLQIHITSKLRQPLLLLEKSPHLQLSSMGFLKGKKQTDAFHTALQGLGQAFATQDFESIYRCSISLVHDNSPTTTLSLSSANSQLHALNTESEGFKFGYEPDIAALIDCFVGDTGVLIDVGANFGYFSLYLASRKGFRGMAHAFEPSARGLHDLNQLVAGFGLKDRIGIYPYALGDTAGSANIFLSNSDGLTTLVASMANRLEKVVREETVEVRRLDDFQFGQVDLIKIDVEGAEALVIAGGISTIEINLPVVVFESWSSVDDSSAFANLHDRGYDFFVPTWLNSQAQHSVSITDAVDPSQVVLIMFEHSERSRLPERINVVAVPELRLQKLSAGTTIG